MSPRAVDYDPNPQVNPTTGGSDFAGNRATPDNMGAQVGEALQRGGAQLEQSSDKVASYVLERQGMINETLATDAETQAMSHYGEIVGKYKSTEGLATVAAQPAAIADIQGVRQKIAASLPNDMARKAFVTLALRHEGYAIEDINTYGAQQVKAADTKSAQDSMELGVANSGRYEVASNQQRFEDSLHDANFAAVRIMRNQGYGPEAGTGMAQAPDGSLTFDAATSQGQAAKAAYDQLIAKAHGQAWENRIHALADDPQNGNIDAALKTFNEHRADIPAEAQSRLSAYLEPKARSSEVRTGAQAILSGVETDYQKTLGTDGPVTTDKAPAKKFTEDDAASALYSIVPNVQITSGKRSPEHNAAVGGVSDSMHLDGQATDFVLPPGMTADQAKAKIQEKGLPITEWVDEGSHVHWGWGQKGGAAIAQADSSPHQSRADYYRDNFSTIMQKTREQAEQLHPGDQAFSDQMVARTEAVMTDEIRGQELKYTSDLHTVQQATTGAFTNGKRPTSMDEIEAISPELKDAVESVRTNQPLSYNAIEQHILPSNARGEGGALGAQFYDLLQRVTAPATDKTRIGAQKDLMPFVRGGDKGPLTATGLNVLTAMMGDRGKPTGEAEASALHGFFQTAHHELTGSNPQLNVSDPKGDELFEKFTVQALNDYAAGKAAGKTQAQLLDPKSPDYIGASMGAYRRSLLQLNADIFTNESAGDFGTMMGGASTTGAPQTAANVPNVTGQPVLDKALAASGANTSTAEGVKDAMRAAVRADPNNRALYDAAVAYGVKQGWITPPPPEVPISGAD